MRSDFHGTAIPLRSCCSGTALSGTDRSILEHNQQTFYSIPGFTGPLDALSALPAAAYSLRRLTGSYTGKAINVRRDSDNAATDIGFVNGALDTATLLAFVGSGSGYVTTWYNQGTAGSTGDQMQATATWQPAIVISGTLQTINGVPSLYFDSTSVRQQLNSSGNVTYNSAGAWSTNIVGNYQTPGYGSSNNLATLNMLSSTGNVFIGPMQERLNYSGSTPTGITYFYLNSSGTMSGNTQSFDATKFAAPFIHTSVQTLSGSTLSATNYINGDSQSITISSAAGSPPTSGQVLIGGGGAQLGGGTMGYVAEAFAFGGALSPADCSSLEHNQENYFNIAGV